MDELLKQILSNELLTEETKSQLQEGIKKIVAEAVKTAEAKATVEVQHRLAEEYVEWQDKLLEAIDTKVNESLEVEFVELKEDVERFRDLEKEYAEKIVETREEMAKEMSSDLDNLVERLDAYLTVVLSREIEELREDIEHAKTNDFGKKIVEAFAAEYEKHIFKADETLQSRYELEGKLTETVQELERTQRKIAKMERSKKLSEVLSPLSGKQKDIMEAILANVDTDMLAESYSTYIGRVIKESTDTPKNEKIITEGVKDEPKGVVKTGDILTEAEVEPKEITPQMRQLRILAGIDPK
jgi:hypothetical protein